MRAWALASVVLALGCSGSDLEGARCGYAETDRSPELNTYSSHCLIAIARSPGALVTPEEVSDACDVPEHGAERLAVWPGKRVRMWYPVNALGIGEPYAFDFEGVECDVPTD